jgi:FixJ family two-component response regulator
MALRQDVIAVVDDDPDMREALADLLSAYGYLTEEFASAEQFLGAVKTSKATCLVVDLQLGGISGVDLVRQLFATGCKLPVIFVTGCQDDTLCKQARDLGCVAFLKKPFQADQLISAVAQAMESNADL